MEYTVEYTGYGTVHEETCLHLAPKQAKSIDVTHASLALAKVEKSTDFDVTVVFSNDETLRQNDPANTWEVFWLFFNYRINSGTGKKDCNYFILKPNGCELGTAYDELGQTFIATTNEPKNQMMKKYILRVVKIGKRVQVYLDHKLVMDSTDERYFDMEGDIGFYTEDCHVVVYSYDFVKLK